MSDTADRIRKIVADMLGQDVANVTDAAEFFNDLGADSLEVVDVHLAIESEFDILIDDELVERMKTVGDLVRYVEGRTG